MTPKFLRTTLHLPKNVQVQKAHVEMSQPEFDVVQHTILHNKPNKQNTSESFHGYQPHTDNWVARANAMPLSVTRH